MSQPTELKGSPLEEEHRALGAHIGAFAGWTMPIQYAGTLAEHRAVREGAGLFDLTHLGKIVLEGSGALEAIQRSMPNDARKIAVGAAQYNMVLNERGGIVDDLIVYRTSEQRYLVVPNAANTSRVHRTLLQASDGPTDVVLREDLCILAPQGPRSPEVVARVFPEAPTLGYMHSAELSYRGRTMTVSRSGYTGERGFELFVPDDLAPDLWRELLAAGEGMGLLPCGLAARDTLRLEMGYPLHGNDISEERTPLEAGLSWAVSLDKGDFLGRDALMRQKEEGVPSRLWGLRMQDRLIPRPHYRVMSGGEQVGETTSGTFSPTLKVGIAMAYLSPRERFTPGDRVEVDVRGRRGEAEVLRPPFVDSSPK
ncbi:MAG: glycine cleavage system aminomethyltransferase GcvT [Actinobacteria bacterium]|nr:glycine cleavage system aminomethyltransferase GcvT [Actinomycetota bacterium]